MKFKNIKEENSAKAILKEGAQTPFWELIVQALTESKEHIQNQMDSADMEGLSADQYKFQNECFKAKKNFIDTLIRTPDNIASWLEKPETERPKEFDPYDRG